MSLPQPHDLLWGLAPRDLPGDAPDWARQVLAAGAPVVVRRASCAEGWVAVGLRGHGREQRLGVLMPLAAITRRLSPEDLRWHGPSDWPALQALAAITHLLDARLLAWGPTGAAGYQLATGCEVLHAGSDLDLVLRMPQALERAAARGLLASLEQTSCRIDTQLETPNGAVALRDWAGTAPRVLLKSARGACLVADPWQALEQAA